MGCEPSTWQLEEFNGQPPSYPGNVYYIRAEVVRHVWKRLDHVPVVGERVRICRRASLGWSRVFGNSSGTEDRY